MTVHVTGVRGESAADIARRTGLAESDATDAEAITQAFDIAIGTKQDGHVNLTALAGLTGAAAKMIEFTGAGAMTLRDIGNAGRLILAMADYSAVRTALTLTYASSEDATGFTEAGKVMSPLLTGQAIDAKLTGNLASLKGLTLAADKLPYATGAATLALTDLTAAGRALLDDADASAQLTTLGFSAFAKTLIDDASAAAVLTTLGVSGFFQLLLDETDGTGVMNGLGFSTHGRNLVTAADYTAMKSLLNLTIGTNVQAQNVKLQSIADLTTPAGRFLYTTATNTYDLGTITEAGRNLLDDASTTAQLTTLGLSANGRSLVTAADYTAMKTLLGLTIGTDVQAQDAGLQSIAGLTTAANRMLYTTDVDTYAVTTLTAFARSLLDDADAATVMGTLGFSANARSLVAAADYAAMRTLLGLVVGTNVQAYDAGLQSIAGLTTAADRMIYTTAADTYATAPLTGFARTLLDDADAATARATLGAAAASAGYGANQFYDSRDPAMADATASGNVVVDVEDAALLALGFTRALEKGSNGSIIQARNLEQPLEGGEYYAVALVVKAADDASWGTAVRLYGYNAAGASIVTPINLTTWEAIGSNARRYTGFGQFSTSWAGVARLGLGVATAGDGLQAMGSQFHVRSYPVTGIDAADYPAEGEGAATLSDVTGANQFVYGNNPDRAALQTTGNSVVDVTDADLLARGFTRAVAYGASSTWASFGQRLRRRMRGNEYYAAVVAVHTDTADDFGDSVRLQAYRNGGQTLAATAFLTLKERLSATAALYSVEGQATTDWAGVDALRLAVAPGDAEGIQIMGGQFAVEPRRIRGIAAGDFPTTGDDNRPIYPSHLWLREGRPLPFYVGNVMEQRNALDAPVICAFRTMRDSDRLPYFVEGRHQLLIDPAYCGTTGAFDFRQEGAAWNTRYRLPVTIHTAPAAKAGSPRMLFIGDSLTNRGLAELVKERMTLAGMTPSFIGTLTGWDESGTTQDGTAGEGREGWKVADFTYMETTKPPIADNPTAVSNYLAAAHATRVGSNPFLRAEVGSETNARNGYVFDPDFYVTRFGYSDPDVVVIGLGTNDGDDDFEASPPIVEEGLTIMVEQTRAAFPSAKILLWYPIKARSNAGDGLWERADREIIKRIDTLARTFADDGDTGVFFLGAHAHLSMEGGWDQAGALDAETGLIYGAVSDATHFGQGELREQLAEVVTNAIMALT